MERLAQCIARLNNSIINRKVSVRVVNSSLSRRVAMFLVQQGFLLYSRRSKDDRTLTLGLKYTGEGISMVKGVEIISTPGKRVTATIPQLRGGKLEGEYVISTSRGLCTRGQALGWGVGGVLLVRLNLG